MTSPTDPRQEARAQARPEDEQWWANRVAAQAEERARSEQSPSEQVGTDSGVSATSAFWRSLGAGGYTPGPQRDTLARSGFGLGGALSDPDSARSALYLLLLSVGVGIAAGLVVLLMAVVFFSTVLHTGG
ncbi:MAG: hypothetical protein ACRDY2_11720 [Acidimicrobiales bacterium]